MTTIYILEQNGGAKHKKNLLLRMWEVWQTLLNFQIRFG
jgi:hypothetical protein